MYKKQPRYHHEHANEEWEVGEKIQSCHVTFLRLHPIMPIKFPVEFISSFHSLPVLGIYILLALLSVLDSKSMYVGR